MYGQEQPPAAEDALEWESRYFVLHGARLGHYDGWRPCRDASEPARTAAALRAARAPPRSPARLKLARSRRCRRDGAPVGDRGIVPLAGIKAVVKVLGVDTFALVGDSKARAAPPGPPSAPRARACWPRCWREA